MATKDSKTDAPETYGAVVEQLESVVKRLEEGELSLEDSLREFEQGIKLVRRGEEMLGQAERRVEQLLQSEGEDRVAPLNLQNGAAPAVKARARSHMEAVNPDRSGEATSLNVCGLPASRPSLAAAALFNEGEDDYAL